MSATGPIARASGVTRDLRKDEPYLAYADFDFNVPCMTTGDCFARYLVRIEEMRESLKIVEQAIEKRSDLDDSDIEVEVKDGIARLSGTVASEDDRLSAAMAARSTRGVRSVLWNDLQVNPSS